MNTWLGTGMYVQIKHCRIFIGRAAIGLAADSLLLVECRQGGFVFCRSGAYFVHSR